MLPRIVLLVVQIAAAWFLGDRIKAAIPSLTSSYDIFIYAVIYAVIIMVIGFAGSLIMKNIRVPTAGTFVASLVLAFIFAAIAAFFSAPIQNALPFLSGNAKLYPLVGAFLGYILKR